MPPRLSGTFCMSGESGAMVDDTLVSSEMSESNKGVEPG